LSSALPRIWRQISVLPLVLSQLKLHHVEEARMHHVIRSSGDAERALNSTRCREVVQLAADLPCAQSRLDEMTWSGLAACQPALE
jgi:hypothetical protein